ncbi:MAG TPA: P-II family nitrogen regulator, partial [Solirubrobacteraceae bacterium]|nr:P-II family nitrogen regulator [Solirubrobacteraceae bacterium]
MKKIEAIIRAERLQSVQDALDELGVSGLTVSEVMGCGRQKGYTEQYRGSRVNISLLPKLKVESVVPSDVVEATVD